MAIVPWRPTLLQQMREAQEAREAREAQNAQEAQEHLRQSRLPKIWAAVEVNWTREDHAAIYPEDKKRVLTLLLSLARLRNLDSAPPAPPALPPELWLPVLGWTRVEKKLPAPPEKTILWLRAFAFAHPYLGFGNGGLRYST